MLDHLKSVEVHDPHSRIRSVYDWLKPVFWGLGIGAFIGGVMVATIFLDRKGFLPNWMFGWISSDRETQKRQFQLALYGFFSLWAVSRLIKLGLFGEAARTTYERMLLRLEIVQSKSTDEAHNQVCPVENVRVAGFLVAFLTLEVFLSWNALGKPMVQHSLYDLLFRIVLWLLAIFPFLLKVTKCVPERLILAILMTRIVTGFVFEYSPNLFNPNAKLISQSYFVLWVFALLISLALLVSSVSRSMLST